ncbi:MAG: hypothetical protein COX57_13445 [Alphaproteobacteria bacterium CG_4_10_14_0_2_um_filter_63_37]|nr:MAG: hypothetical protein AUJ55_12750 [Proteobacteria bacterium CG1_02_64_396]PJA23486.1 MAG: hypothetical protein COX57_13445 [Alphaproteobacteria bacterium CG_4_10_14_0_2_um_filter_63_37]
MTTLGKKNMIFGLAYFLTTLALGMFLASKMGSGGPEWANSMQRAVLKAAHAHGNLEAVLNIVLGFLLCRFGAPSVRLAQVASVLLIVGALGHSGMLYLGGLGLSTAFNLTPIGGISLIAAIALMIPILIKGVQPEER